MELGDYNTVTSKQLLDTIVSFLDEFLKEQTKGRVYVRFIKNEDQVTTDSNVDVYKINYYSREYKFEIREKESNELLTNLCTRVSIEDFTSNSMDVLSSGIDSINKESFSMLLTYMMVGRTTNVNFVDSRGESIRMMSIRDILNKYKN